MHAGRGRPHDRKSKTSVGLTRLLAAGTIGSGLNERQPEVSIAQRLLAPLREGKPVALVVDDPRLPKRKRIEKPLLFLTPITGFGAPSTKLMVALQTYGCELIDTLEQVKPSAFYRMGLNMKLASLLAEELNLVFTKGEVHHGNKRK